MVKFALGVQLCVKIINQLFIKVEQNKLGKLFRKVEQNKLGKLFRKVEQNKLGKLFRKVEQNQPFFYIVKGRKKNNI